jgi:hypothetical protein
VARDRLAQQIVDARLNEIRANGGPPEPEPVKSWNGYAGKAGCLWLTVCFLAWGGAMVIGAVRVLAGG